MSTMLKPDALKKGDLIAIAAPASSFDKKVFLASVARFEGLGFRVIFRNDIFSSERYLAGSDKRRAEELNQFFADPKVKAIFFARGGYGTQRILHLLDPEVIKASPKIVVGYSDITALHIWLNKHEIGGTFYGPTVAKHFIHAHQKTIDLLFNLLTGQNLSGLPTAGAKVLKAGEAEGILTGGCLSLITSTIGTPYELPAKEGTILFLEDVNEPVYKYDRMLTQLKISGRLRGVNGIILGPFSLAKGENVSWLNKMLKDVLADFPGPIITNFPSGHLDLKKFFVTLPLGVKVRLSTKPVMLEILEAPFKNV